MFKIGDRIKLLPNEYSYSDNDEDPIWDGVCGKIIGTIKSIETVYTDEYEEEIDEEDIDNYDSLTCIQYIKVKWDNGHTNRYVENELEYVEKKEQYKRLFTEAW